MDNCIRFLCPLKEQCVFVQCSFVNPQGLCFFVLFFVLHVFSALNGKGLVKQFTRSAKM
jgi:hypothetical protein